MKTTKSRVESIGDVRMEITPIILTAVLVIFSIVVIALLAGAFHKADKPNETEILQKTELIDKLKSGDFTSEEFDYIVGEDKELMRLKHEIVKE